VISRRKTRSVRVGSVVIGGEALVSVQSMTCTRTDDVKATSAQINRLEKAGCDIVRVAVPDLRAAQAIGEIKKRITIPLVADIHFDYRLALEAVRQGADKIRINPGNIGSGERVKCVLDAAGGKGLPIRIGVNSGSLEKALLKKHGAVTAEALAESALEHVRMARAFGFHDIVVSIKASNVPCTIEANRLFSRSCDCPVHLGVTEAGTVRSGAVRSAIGIGTLLAEGIGDTIRVSLTADPEEEIRAGWEILKSLKLRSRGITLVSCPTCGRLQTKLIPIVNAAEKAFSRQTKALTVAVMGCAVNGPGEAKEADIGVACGRGSALLFRKGKIVKKIAEKDILKTLVKEVEQWQG